MQKESCNNSAVPLLNRDSKKKKLMVCWMCLALLSAFTHCLWWFFAFFYSSARCVLTSHLFTSFRFFRHFYCAFAYFVRLTYKLWWFQFEHNIVPFKFKRRLIVLTALHFRHIFFYSLSADLVRTWNSLQINSNFRTLRNHSAVALFCKYLDMRFFMFSHTIFCWKSLFIT